MLKFFTVGYVYTDESTPREEHFRTVKAIDANEAKKEVQIQKILSGDRVKITGAMTNS